MLHKVIVLILFVNVINGVFANCRKGQNETICQVVRCGKFVEICDKGEHLIERDPKKCICCNTCEKDPVPPPEPESQCQSGEDSSICDRADCRSLECCVDSQHIVKANPSKCICCDQCADNTST